MVHLSGDNRNEIGANNGVGAGNVSNIVNEWKKGRYLCYVFLMRRRGQVAVIFPNHVFPPLLLLAIDVSQGIKRIKEKYLTVYVLLMLRFFLK